MPDDDLPPPAPRPRLAVLLVPLAALAAAPAQAAPGETMTICSGLGERVILVPPGREPVAPAHRREPGCAHFACLRDHGKRVAARKPRTRD